jgi:hypothetical protein
MVLTTEKFRVEITVERERRTHSAKMSLLSCGEFALNL